MERVGASQHGGQRLYGDSSYIDLGLLSGEGDAGGLGMSSQHPGARILCGVAVTHLMRPDSASGAELGDLLEEVIMHIEEERQAGRELVYLKTAGQRAIHIRQ